VPTPHFGPRCCQLPLPHLHTRTHTTHAGAAGAWRAAGQDHSAVHHCSA
jgi:hypothetical protein